MTWQTRTLCTYIGATAPAGGQELIESAQDIGRLPSEKKTAGDVASKGPEVGSYEAFMATFGRGGMTR